MTSVTNYCEAILGENFEAKKSIRLIPELFTCSDQLLDLIFTYSKPVNLEPGEVLVEEGMFDQWIYFVVKGYMDVTIDGVSLGTTAGPMVGERCILGEPRGATLKAGSDGIMALGIEMSAMDEINREVNNFSNNHDDEDLVEQFSEEKMLLVLELEAIILNEVILRILDLSRTSFQVLGQLSRALIARETGQKYDPGIEKQSDAAMEETHVHNVLESDFEIFSKKVYDSLVGDPIHGEDIGALTFEQWAGIFSLNRDGSKVLLMDGFKKLNRDHGFLYADLADIIILIFEITSQYTTKLNASLNNILTLFEDEEDRKGALKLIEKPDLSNAVIEARISKLRSKLFGPVEEALESGKCTELENAVAKMSQADIDALFG